MTDLFEEKAQDWDANEMVGQLSLAIGSAILSNVSLKPDMQVMDFGAGTGLISKHVAPHVNRITAVDISEAMLSKLAAKAELQDKVQTVCRDILQQPMDDRFDLLMSAMAMHHVEDTDTMVKRFAEHLKPGAYVALADLDKEDGSFHGGPTDGVYHSGFERSQLQDVLENNGFDDVRFVTAHTVQKEGKSYPVFLMLARRTH
jgi:predicted TPR repeat methyltransferase